MTLDRGGTFVHAVNVPGVSLTATATVMDWISPNYGTTANDDRLELVPEPATLALLGLGALALLRRRRV